MSDNTTADAVTMTIQRTGKRVVMYGEAEPAGPGRWFERYFDDEARAAAYAAKRGWIVTEAAK